MISSFLSLMRQYGSDFSLVQGGGGNASIKEGPNLKVKASGTKLKNLLEGELVAVDLKRVLDLLRDPKFLELDEKSRDHEVVVEVQNCVVGKSAMRPSIETFLHALLPQKFVVHLHSMLINGITCRKGGKDIAKQVFSDLPYLWVPYAKPGLPLALELSKRLQLENVAMVLLENHGVIYASDDLQDLNSSLKKSIQLASDFLGAWEWSSQWKVGLEQDTEILIEQAKGALYPDHVVFCGGPGIIVNAESELLEAQENYQRTYHAHARYGIVGGRLRVFHSNDSDEFLKFLKAHLETYRLTLRNNGSPQLLRVDEIVYLNDWESEKYRRKMAKK